MFLQNGVRDGYGGCGRRVQGELYGVYGLLLEYVAGEEEEGCEYEDWIGVSRANWRHWGRRGEMGDLAYAGGYCDGDLAACEEHGGGV